MCLFGPDSAGVILEEIVPERTAKSACVDDNWGQNCVCHELETSCLLGPDSACNFATETVSRDFADTCARDGCTCTSHTDYMSVANERLEGATECLERLQREEEARLQEEHSSIFNHN